MCISASLLLLTACPTSLTRLPDAWQPVCLQESAGLCCGALWRHR